jgi:hypothetical protein
MKSTSNTRFRLLLPPIFLGLSITLMALGQAQIKWVVDAVSSRSARHLSFGNIDILARASFVDSALNAPAWAAAQNMPYVLRVEGWLSGDSSLRFQADLWYLLFVVLMWFLIGYRLDRWREEELTGQTSSFGHLRVRVFLVICGAFVCWSAVKYNSAGWDYEKWFLAAVLAWGVGLIFAGLCPFSPTWRWVWRVFYGALGLLVGAGSFWFGILLFQAESLTEVDHSAGVAVLAWGTLLILAALYLLLGPFLHRGIKVTNVQSTQDISPHA